ncbi:MAG: aminodeoxychorismate synthase component I [Bacteroidetes bacterium 4484_249]|nr:MAG: aminodeoxychorismate synthase component I [Bacteroidetes bacterium 4484_249]
MQQLKNTIKLINKLGSKSIPFVFIFDYEMLVPEVFIIEELEKNNIWVSVPRFSNKKTITGSLEFTFNKYPVEYSRYKKAFDVVMDSINRGDTFLLNLTFPAKLNTDLSLSQIFELSHAKYKLKYEEKFTVFSPESFITIAENEISCYPMKGTMDAGIKDAETILMNDIKEVSEHNTIVDLIRNDLSMVAKNVRVEKFRYIEKIKTHEKVLLQTSSKICGDLPAHWNERIGDLIYTLLPAGSITGAPKQKTLEIIKEAEEYERGYFTGVFGYFDGKKLDSAVMIRFIENTDDGLIFKSGGGITSFSNCESEYREMIDKVYVPFN